MNVQQFIDLLNQVEDKSQPLRLLKNSFDYKGVIIDFTEENILFTSETAYVNPDAPENEHDCEDGKIELGDGQRFVLLNPIIV